MLEFTILLAKALTHGRGGGMPLEMFVLLLECGTCAVPLRQLDILSNTTSSSAVWSSLLQMHPFINHLRKAPFHQPEMDSMLKSFCFK